MRGGDTGYHLGGGPSMGNIVAGVIVLALLGGALIWLFRVAS